jgi:hypothetical protein
LKYIQQNIHTDKKTPGIRPQKEIKELIKCGKDDTVQTCYTSIFERLKKLSSKIVIDSNETKELNYYYTLLKNQEKFMRDKLFPVGENRYKLLDLKYRFS